MIMLNGSSYLADSSRAPEPMTRRRAGYPAAHRDVRRKPSLLSTAFGPPSPHTAVDREAGWSPTEVPRQAVASRDDHTEEARKPASMAADRYLAENSPALTPATKAVHSSAVNRRTGLLASLESRSRTSSPDMATSTQALLPQKLLLRQSVR